MRLIDYTGEYEQLGFHAGLEIHAQLKSSRKLFCHCSPELIPPDAKPDYHFERRFRPVLGEMGTFDAGMLVEFEKAYRVIYDTYADTICTYELDETPPFYPDPEIIKIGFLIGNFFNAKSRVDEIIFNRKQYLDGSIPTGFQRTAIIARDGEIFLREGKRVRINNILIEEDAARRVNFHNRWDRTVYFNLDRLGIPLTEIITNHEDCNNPEELLEIALLLGLSLRVMDVGKRGIGTVRQDVNISISGGSRVELKGIQNIRDIKKYADHEIFRQKALLAIKDELLERGLSKKDFQANYIDVTSATSFTQDESKDKAVAFAIRLPNCKGIFTRSVQPNKAFDEEIFDRCELITGLRMLNITSSDNPANWLDLPRVTEIMNLSIKDAFIVVKGEQKTVFHTLTRLLERLNLAIIGVPQETRRVNTLTYNSEFLRVIHGKDRMYSDTDTPPLPVDDTIRSQISIAVKPWDLYKYNNNISIYEIKHLVEHCLYSTYVSLVLKYPLKNRRILGFLQKYGAFIEDNNLSFSEIGEELEFVLIDVLEHKLSRDKVEEILLKVNKGSTYNSIKADYADSMKNVSETKLRQIKGILTESVNSKGGLSYNNAFRILKTHFPMLTSEQLLYSLKKSETLNLKGDLHE